MFPDVNAVDCARAALYCDRRMMEAYARPAAAHRRFARATLARSTPAQGQIGKADKGTTMSLNDFEHSIALRDGPGGTRATLLAAQEPRAPTANLSPTKRAALLAFVNGDGTLHKCAGVWRSPAAGASERPVFGVTVADLARDGMVTVTITGKMAVAALTPRGSWFARTAATEAAEHAGRP